MKQTIKNFSKLIIIIVLVLALVITNFNFFSNVNITQVNAWDGSTITQAEGEGTEESPFLISNGDELAWVSQQTNNGTAFSDGKYFELTDNIDLEGNNFTPIGDYNNADIKNVFSGNFEGNGFKITTLNVLSTTNYYGLFGYINGGEVNDINIRLSDILISEQSEVAYIGVVAGYTENSEITKIKVNADISITSTSPELYIGGIVGKARNTDIEECSSNARIIVNNSITLGSVYVGGILGKAENRCSIEESYNEGNINVITLDIAYVGGVVGNTQTSNIRKCYNDSAISVEAGTPYLGGITGIFTEDVLAIERSIKYSYNNGSLFLKATNNVANIAYVGGITGYIGQNYIIDICYNVATIDVNEVIVPLNSNIRGSLVGYLNADASVTSCFYDTSKAEYGDDGIGDGDGTTTDNYGRQTSELITATTYNLNDEWNFDGVWIIQSSLNNGYPILENVGNAYIFIQIGGGGDTSIAGIRYYEVGVTQVYTVLAIDQYQVKTVLIQQDSGTETLTQYSGTAGFTIQIVALSGGTNLYVGFEPIPFTKTLAFLIVLIFAGLILIVVAGFFLINYRYDKKVRKAANKSKELSNMRSNANNGRKEVKINFAVEPELSKVKVPRIKKNSLKDNTIPKSKNMVGNSKISTEVNSKSVVAPKVIPTTETKAKPVLAKKSTMVPKKRPVVPNVKPVIKSKDNK